jgi:hypothetical protein
MHAILPHGYTYKIWKHTKLKKCYFNDIKYVRKATLSKAVEMRPSVAVYFMQSIEAQRSSP